jgi:hypothetical protein
MTPQRWASRGQVWSVEQIEDGASATVTRQGHQVDPCDLTTDSDSCILMGMTKEEDASSFWRTLPGILTAVTGFVTAVTGFLVILHQAGVFGREAPKPEPSPPMSGSSSSGANPSADSISGTWSGEAVGQDHVVFRLDLQVKKPCVLKGYCGSISVSQVPCHGEVFLEHVLENGYEFRVDHFTKDSGSQCAPGAGEVFTPRPDQTLVYTATYAPYATGTLRKISD